MAMGKKTKEMHLLHMCYCVLYEKVSLQWRQEGIVATKTDSFNDCLEITSESSCSILVSKSVFSLDAGLELGYKV